MAKEILIGFGGNIPSHIGAPLETIKRAIKLLENEGLSFLKTSSPYCTAPIPASDQPDFVNVAAVVKTNFSPAELLQLFQRIEVGCGRKPAERWSARTLDIDLLSFEDQILPSQQKWQAVVSDRDPAAILQEPVVPHPRLHIRAFVLVPLMEVAPDWLHPVLCKTVKEFAETQHIQAESVGVREISAQL